MKKVFPQKNCCAKATLECLIEEGGRVENSRKFDSRGAVEKIFFDTIFFEEFWVSSRKIRSITTFMFINKHLVTYAK